jgi:hypothetical protein
MSDNEVILNYEGPIDFETLEKILRLVKDDLASHNIKKVVKKRIYSILVECLENILRHGTDISDNRIHPYIKLEKGINVYQVTAGNLILNSTITLLEEKLSKIAHCNKEQLQIMYKNQINKDAVLSKDGAGLGFITIALKSNIPLNYKFIPVNDQFSVFELQVIIHIENN